MVGRLMHHTGAVVVVKMEERHGSRTAAAAGGAAVYDGRYLSPEAPETRRLLPAAIQHHSRGL